MDFDDFMTNEREGPLTLPQFHQPIKLCSGCKYHTQTMIHSGRDPLYHHHCHHPAWAIEQYRFIGKNETTPHWCPFLTPGTLESPREGG